jgi:hypothetical protein
VHNSSLKQLEGTIKWLQDELERGHEMGIIIDHLEVLRDLEDFQMTVHIVAMGGPVEPKQMKAGEDQGMATCQEMLKAVGPDTGQKSGRPLQRNPS